jgi:HD domain
MDIVAKARQYAATKHAGQKKKYSEQPYFNHLEAVVSGLQCAGINDPTMIAAAYLHDVVEPDSQSRCSSMASARPYCSSENGLPNFVVRSTFTVLTGIRQPRSRFN